MNGQNRGLGWSCADAFQRIRLIPNFSFSLLFGVALGLTQLPSAHAAMIIWDFNLPSTAVASQNPPYPSVAKLTLEDTVDGVKFTLDPNEANSGYESNSTVDALNIVFSGAADLPSSAYRWESGPVANAETFGNNNSPLVAVVPPPNSAVNMDSGYSSGDGQLKLTWDNPDFNVTDTSMWTILGTTIANNFSILATSGSKPTPTFGIFSVSPISLDNLTPTPSNWVTGSIPVPDPSGEGELVPEPASAVLLVVALAGLAIRYRKLGIA